MSDYESGSPPSRGEMMETLNPLGMNLNVLKNKLSPTRVSSPYRLNGVTSTPLNKRTSTSCNGFDYEEVTLDRRHSLCHSFDQTYDLPDFRPNINTVFTSDKFNSSPKQQINYDNGFDFGIQYKQLSDEHRKSVIDDSKIYKATSSSEQLINSPAKSRGGFNEFADSSTCVDKALNDVPTIWCMDYQENLIVIGCANGSLEFWEGTTGKFKVDE